MAASKRHHLLLLVILVFCLSGNGVYAFGAGNIPSYGHLKGKAFRHGDIEEVLGDLFKRHGVKVGMIGNLVGRHKFSPMDIKRIYFGNWLRDYSQAMDIATLKKAPWQSIITIVVVLGFMAHGYATDEFEVTRERLGVYLPVEHIDNPKGYGEGENPREVDPGLRSSVLPEETEIDPKTGMKNYIANDSGSWDTSRAYVRRTLEKCIELGRRYRSADKPKREDKYEAFRLLGAALHTLEDYPAHSNFCELCLVSMGHAGVFTHVGEAVKIQAPDGRMVTPVVTGVFGADDFMHSLFAEGSDRISESSLTDLNHSVLVARRKKKEQGNSTIVAVLKKMLSKAPGDTAAEISNDLDEIEKIGEDNEASAEGKEGKTKPEQMTPQELHHRLWKILNLRDKVVKTIDRTIERVPGLRPLLNKINEQISVIVFIALGPILEPLMRLASTSLQGASQEVLSTHDQFEVFENPYASDPTHSFLSKDHFTDLLNQPAGNIAKIIVSNTVTLVVHAWDDKNLDVAKTIDEITECLFHPDFYDGKSKVQSMMLGYMHQWVEGLGHKKKSMFERLTKESVREHKNVLRQGETGVSQALVNPLGLPTLEDLKSKSPPPGVNASVVGTHQGKPVYFSPGVYGKGGDASPVSRIGTSPTFSPPYAPSIADSEVSSQDQRGYQWNPGLTREGEGFISQSTEDFYSTQRSTSLPTTSNFYSPPPGPPQSTEGFYNPRQNSLERSTTTGHIPPQWGPSQFAQDFYSSPSPPQFQSPIPGPPQQPGDQLSKNPLIRQMSSPPQSQSRGMDFYAQSPQQGSQQPYNPHSPQSPQISPEAASFYTSPPPQSTGHQPRAIPQAVADQNSDKADPLAELTANLRRF